MSHLKISFVLASFLLWFGAYQFWSNAKEIGGIFVLDAVLFLLLGLFFFFLAVSKKN